MAGAGCRKIVIGEDNVRVSLQLQLSAAVVSLRMTFVALNAKLKKQQYKLKMLAMIASTCNQWPSCRPGNLKVNAPTCCPYAVYERVFSVRHGMQEESMGLWIYT